MAQALFQQPPFAQQLNTKAFPLTNGGGGSSTLQTGYMIWASPGLSAYNGLAMIQYLYNPSTVASDYNVASADAQAAMNFPTPGNSAQLAIPLSQTVQWSLMFDRTFELWNGYSANGLPNAIATSANNGTASTDPSVIGCQADVLAFMQFTGMLANWSGASATALGGAQATSLLAGNSGVMALIPAWAIFANNNVANGLTYYGFINEWSVQYTHFTQFNVPMRCVISVNWTMMPMPNTQPPAPAAVTTLPNGQPGPGSNSLGSPGIGGT